MKHNFFLAVAFAIAFLANAEDGKVGDSDSDLPELKIEILHVPDECVEKSAKGNMLSMHYKGTLESGIQFDST